MIQDKTYKIQVGDYNDAVIYVYSHRNKIINPKDSDDKHRWKHWKEVETVVPISWDMYGDDREEQIDLFHQKVKAVADALAELYSRHIDYEIGVSYTMNTDQYVTM